MRKTAGDTIRLLRKKNNLKQWALAHVLGLPTSTLCQYETGARALNLETADIIAEKFEVSIDYLCGVHDLQYNPRDKKLQELINLFNDYTDEQKQQIIDQAKDEKLQELINIFNNCTDEQKQQIVNHAKKLLKGGN